MGFVPLSSVDLDDYVVSDMDTANDTKYYGYLKSNGRFYVMREVSSTGEFRFYFGTSGYSTAWTGRAGLSYSLFSEAF